MIDEESMQIEKMISKAARVGKLYNLEHFHTAWQDPQIHRLMGNELLYPPSPHVIKAIQKFIPQLNYYPEDAGTAMRLRTELANYLGLEGGADWITLGNGSMEIIDMIPRTFLDEGDEVLLPSPEYSPYARRPQLYGGRIIDVIPSGEEFSYKLDDFLTCLSERSKLIILSRPNAPVGNMVPRELLEELLKLPVMILVDEAYAEFSQQSISDLLLDYPQLIVSRTFSKAMGLGGIRLGFVAAQPETIQFIERVRVPLNTSLITQIAALAALEDVDYIRRNTENVIKTREEFTDNVNRIKGLKVYPSQGNSVLVNCRDSEKTAAFFVDKLFSEGYLVRNQSNTRGLAGDFYFRITIGTQQDMHAVAEIMSDAMEH